MKVNREKLETFQPFKLVLEIETEEEARGLFAIFNHSANCELLPDYLPGQIRAQIGPKKNSTFTGEAYGR